MQKIKLFSKQSSMGFASMGVMDYEALEADVNSFIAKSNLEVIDIQYRVETTGTIIIASVMVVYKEK